VESSPGNRVVLTDASVLINFLHLDRLDLLGNLPGHEFLVPDHVAEEIRDPGQRQRLETGIRSGFLTILPITDLEEVESYARFHRTLGQGESACLAVALRRGCFVASDERGLFRRTAATAIGKGRIFTTPDLLVLAIRAGLATVADADGWKVILEANRFRMRFSSFREIL
jgi:predicted nucleic acid-binding protein